MTVLIVDKSKAVRDRIKYLVQNINDSAEIYESKSNREAIRIVEECKPEILVTDIDLIDGSGLSLISFMSKLRPETLKIVFTQHGPNKLKEICLKLGADYFLSKSIDFISMKKILIKIKNQIDQK